MEANSDLGRASSQLSEKKCPRCEKWTRWRFQAEDVCEHCGQLLSTYHQEKEERGERIKSTPLGLFSISESDNVVVKMGKYTANFGYMIFTAFMSFLVWFITVVAG